MLLLVNKHSLVEENLDGTEPREWFNSEKTDKKLTSVFEYFQCFKLPALAHEEIAHILLSLVEKIFL